MRYDDVMKIIPRPFSFESYLFFLYIAVSNSVNDI